MGQVYIRNKLDKWTYVVIVKLHKSYRLKLKNVSQNEKVLLLFLKIVVKVTQKV